MNNVYIVGEKPDWLKNVIHIPFPDSYNNNKDANMINKLIIASLHDSISTEYIRMMDDVIFLKPIEEKFFNYPIISSLNEETVDSKFYGDWIKKLKTTRELLKINGKTSYNYDSHMPVKYNKQKFIDTMLRYPYGEGLGVTLDTLYFNQNLEPYHYTNINKFAVGLGNKITLQEIKKATQDKSIMNFNDYGLNDDLKQFLFDRFPNPSKYETISNLKYSNKDQIIAEDVVKKGGMQQIDELSSLINDIKNRKVQNILEIGSADGATLYM